MKPILFTICLVLISTGFLFGQKCNCKSNFNWLKKTFEKNDAGFKYDVSLKGQEAYLLHNKRILKQVDSAQTIPECLTALANWLKFFRKGHLTIIPLKPKKEPDSIAAKEAKNWPKYSVSIDSFKKYLANKNSADYEGIWKIIPYKMGIKKQGSQYIGFIIDSKRDDWTKGQVKLKINPNDSDVNCIYYMGDHSAKGLKAKMIGKNHIQIGSFVLTRLYPQIKEKHIYPLVATSPYIKRLNMNTLYFRIPSFMISQKETIDSVIAANKKEILSSQNLIIDLRNNGGGSDVSYQKIIPFLYTNPIRSVGVKFLSTQLNNQRMIDIMHNPEYGASTKEWAKKGYDKLQKHLGEFVNLDTTDVEIVKFDTIYPYPQNVGIIVNGGCGSTTEQFLLFAKQSKKVKLFGTTTYGSLDISNMYFVKSPCNDFKLGYALSKSMRIPDFTIDGKGITPDYYIDKSIPPTKWVSYVIKTLNYK